jgi:hypothetical protein
MTIETIFELMHIILHDSRIIAHTKKKYSIGADLSTQQAMMKIAGKRRERVHSMKNFSQPRKWPK